MAESFDKRAEAIIVCFDSSKWMSIEGFLAEREALRRIVETKFKSSRSVPYPLSIGLVEMCNSTARLLSPPLEDSAKLIRFIDNLKLQGGDINVSRALNISAVSFAKQYYSKKRVILFASSVLSESNLDSLGLVGCQMKNLKVSLNFISFGATSLTKLQKINAVCNAAGGGYLFHIPPGGEKFLAAAIGSLPGFKQKETEVEYNCTCEDGETEKFGFDVLDLESRFKQLSISELGVSEQELLDITSLFAEIDISDPWMSEEMISELCDQFRLLNISDPGIPEEIILELCVQLRNLSIASSV